MNKQFVLSALIFALLSVLFAANVWAANSAQAKQALEDRYSIWVGNKIEEGELVPVVLTGKMDMLLSQQQYAFIATTKRLTDVLLKTKNASTGLAKELFKQSFKFEPKSELIEGNRILVKTGGAGVVEFDAEKGRYAVQISPISSVNLNFPPSIKINLDEYIIPIGVNSSGDGTISRITQNDEPPLIKEASAQNPPFFSRVKLAIYYDRNNNGNWDSDENVIPWAGVRVDLVNLDKQSGIKLSDQWKDVYLDNLKQGKKASEVVDDLSKNCPSAGISTIDNNTRKTFLKREGEVFGSEDFDVTPGRVYSIKGCDVPFYIIGYDLEKQFGKK